MKSLSHEVSLSIMEKAAKLSFFLLLFGPDRKKEKNQTQISSSELKPHLTWSLGRHIAFKYL